MELKILGSGCANCKKLELNTREAIKELGIDAEIEKVENFKEIAKFGVMRTPALVIDGEVKAVGKVLTAEEIKSLIK